ncbi:sialic acid-binding Ig-like lectin 11 [Malaclemys terrapin pileata]|uniref:sialic acid-binding Ig-like lectin 11 n=1 Tax=Malaclemys terrapin pileata TaxID=2991368 RepID=UPI0023A8F942|nr:sialic acid-binding Ig-like lectin 11 [Malaclemys terrapin pileata]
MTFELQIQARGKISSHFCNMKDQIRPQCKDGPCSLQPEGDLEGTRPPVPSPCLSPGPSPTPNVYIDLGGNVRAAIRDSQSEPCLSQPDAPAMGRALPPQHDVGEKELWARAPPWRAGGPATLRVLILALLWRESLSQWPGFTLAVPQSVSVQEGLCVLIPCTFTYPASYDTYNSRTRLYRYWYKDPADVDQNPPVASSDPNWRVSQETQGRFRLAENPAPGDCSLQISDARRTDEGRYFFRVEKGRLKYNYRYGTDGTDFTLTISVPDSPRPPNITGTLTRNGRPVLDVSGAEGDVVSLETQEGDSLSLGCEAVSRPEATLSWAKGNESLSPGQGGAGRLELRKLSRGDAGEYQCCAKNSYGSASQALRVHVQSPVRTLQITISRANRSDPQLFQDPGTPVGNGSQITAQEGDSLRFLCSVASSPPAVLGWVRGGRAVEGACPMGENQLRLELPNVTAEDGGLYGCWAQRKESSAQGTFQLLVEYSPRPGTGLNSSCQRQGHSVSCSCSLRSHPPPRVQWQVDGEPVAENGSRGALQVSSWAQGDEAVSTLSWTGNGDSGSQIFCLGSNPHGTYAALHFDFSPPRRGAEEPGKLLGVGVACGLGIAIGFFLLGLCVIKLRGREPAPPSTEAGEMANGSQAEHTADDASLIYSNVPTMPMDHKTPAAHQTEGAQDGAATAQTPLGPGEPEELHYATIDFSKLQRKGVEPLEAPATEYSEVRRK